MDLKFFEEKNQHKDGKLTKAEKRALKFAEKRGVNVEEIENLKGFLSDTVEQKKMSKHALKVQQRIVEGKKGNNSNKFMTMAGLTDA